MLSLIDQVASRHPQSKEWQQWCKRYQNTKPIKPANPMPLSPIKNLTKFF